MNAFIRWLTFDASNIRSWVLLLGAELLIFLAIMYGSWHLWGWFIRFHMGDCP